ncbi:hypothetical protein [Acrocarpospora sp. B8E8]|uniref:hypothetical protein n=1 Tax=Acrocarpospora sp. B8E8 TaxID=3153572 RepID=UPI00325F9641
METRLCGLSVPLVGLGGADTAVPLGLVTIGSAGLAITAYAITIKPRRRDPQPSGIHS